nr:surface lipoprotein assembly modifier [Suttonella ornithocola]
MPALPQALPSDKAALEKVAFTPKYLKEHPEELEALLKQLLASGNEQGLKLLLPIYREVPTADPSVFDWGNAIIAMRENKYAEAVDLYRKLNSQIPDSKTLRFQMALALLANGELIAAKDQFEKLRSGDASKSDTAILDKYISMINSQDTWDIGGGITYAYSDNINNAPPKGTKLLLANGATVSSNTDPKKARGLSYNFYADKTWSIDLAKFASLHINLDGTQYFDQKAIAI